MKTTVISLFLALLMLTMSIICLGADVSDSYTADALNELGLFLGTGNGYELDSGLTRAQGTVLLVRMLGMEEVVEKTVYFNSFTDVPEWAAGYVGYAFENGITNGTSETTFSPDAPMTDYMFLTLVMRALDYSDKGEQPMFVWNNPYNLAYKLNLIKNTAPDAEFTRADSVDVFWNALNTNLNDTDITLSERLIEQNKFSEDMFDEAKEIKANGRKIIDKDSVITNDQTKSESEGKHIIIPGRKPKVEHNNDTEPDDETTDVTEAEEETTVETESEETAEETEQEEETEAETESGAGKGELPIG